MWKYINGNELELPLNEQLKNWIDSDLKAGYQLRVCIGTDSQVYAKRVEFATVIVLRRLKNGGRMVVKKFKQHRLGSLKERMMAEVTFSIEAGMAIREIASYFGLKIEVHADINENPLFESEASLTEARGYILGMGFIFKAKPESFASTSCANRMVQ